MTDKRMTDERLAEIDRYYRFAPSSQKHLLLYRHIGELLQDLKAERKDRNEWAMAAKAEADEVDARGKRIAALVADYTELQRKYDDLRDLCRAAIRSGDWQVDGACDPDTHLVETDDERNQ